MTIKSYGILEQTESKCLADVLAERIRLQGFAIVDSNFTELELDTLDVTFEETRKQVHESFGTAFDLEKIKEDNSIRTLLHFNKLFLDVATNKNVQAVLSRLIPGYYVLNQQNGVINPANSDDYNQGYYHRDLPYQHWVSSRPLAINALFCLDDFTLDNGSTWVIPGSHKQESFPCPENIQSLAVSHAVKRGSYILLDSMIFHSGGVNKTDKDRRAINNVYTIPFIKQQIDLPRLLGKDYVKGDPKLAKLLGYDVEVPQSIEEYYNARK